MCPLHHLDLPQVYEKRDRFPRASPWPCNHLRVARRADTFTPRLKTRPSAHAAPPGRTGYSQGGCAFYGCWNLPSEQREPGTRGCGCGSHAVGVILPEEGATQAPMIEQIIVGLVYVLQSVTGSPSLLGVLWCLVPLYKFEIDFKHVNHLFSCKPCKRGK